MKKYAECDKVALEVIRHDQKAKQIMYVLGYNAQGEVICYWYDHQNNFQKADFPEGLLVKYTPPAPPPFEALGVYYNY